MAAFRHAADRRLDDFLHRAFDHLRRHDRSRRVGAHAAGVRAGIAVADALVVLGGGESQRVFAVAEAEEARLLAVQIGFDHDFGAGGAEGAFEAVIDGCKRFLDCHGDSNALAGSEPIGLDDDRRTLRADIGFRFRRVVEALISAGRDIVAGADIFGEPLEPSNCAAAADGPKTAMPSARNRSARPATSGASGPTTTKSMVFSLQKAAIAS